MNKQSKSSSTRRRGASTGKASASMPHAGWGPDRAVVDAVRPRVDGGAYDVKRALGERVDVEADAFADGHDRLAVILRWRRAGDPSWNETPMRESHNDTWLGSFTPSEIGRWEFSILAWVDPFLTWAHDLERRIDAGQDIRTDLEIGAAIIRRTAGHANTEAASALNTWAARLIDQESSQRQRGVAALSVELVHLMRDASPRPHAVESEPTTVWVDRPLALFGAWYEMFPRSAAFEPGAHGTLRDVIARLPYVREMGFDVLYLPPIHPIGTTARKGPNNTESASTEDVGSPWAIGGPEGGHKSIHPALGTMEDFEALVGACEDHGLELALDIAFQCSPDHPYVKEHPEWFRHRPDGSIQYAENPPKKYQDIYPFDFECEDWRALWEELKSVFDFWIEHGVKVFRVDNPHTKPFPFWDWVIGEIRESHPDVIFLAEAFTRPKKMHRLAKGGFTQSYTYFTWRNGPVDLRAYMEELASPPVCDIMRPNFWPNTPDILTEYLCEGGRNAGMSRLVLAATLASSYGIYGPVYELCEYVQRPGKEENLNSEKYEVRFWNREDRWSLRHFIGHVNRIRREHPALQQFRDIAFHHCDNPAHVAYSKRSADGEDVILCIVNTNHSQEQWGVVRLDLAHLGCDHDAPFAAHDLLTGVRYEWRGADHPVALGPGGSHIFHIERADRSERDFETFV